MDWNKFAKNSLIFFAPLALIYLVFVTAGINADGVQLVDFVPSNEVISMAVLYIINVAIDFFKKFARK
jgi:hypothetical protein